MDSAVLLLSSSETGKKRCRVLFPRAPAHTLLLPGRGGPLSPLTVDSIEKGRIPEPQCVPVKQRHPSLLSQQRGKGSSRPLEGGGSRFQPHLDDEHVSGRQG